MFITVLKSKIHQATITDKNLLYNGSLTLDPTIMQQANMQTYEKVHIFNIHTGIRFETYLIEGKANSKEICLNGAAARLGEIGDKIIIVSYCLLDSSRKEKVIPQQIFLDEKNNIL